MRDERAFLPLERHRARFTFPLGLATMSWWTRFEPGMVLCRAGESARRLLLIEHGAVAWTTVEPTGRCTILAMLGPGDVVGLEAVVDVGDRDRTGATVVTAAVAFGYGRAIGVPLTMAREAYHRSPEVARWVAEQWARRGAMIQARLAGSVALPVGERIIRALLHLAERWGRVTPAGVRIELALPQDSLAAMTGATRESVNRALRKLSMEGRVVRSGHVYTVKGGGGTAELPLASEAGVSL